MTQYAFGSGQLYTTPVGGGVPLAFGAIQNVTVDIQADVKQLYGSLQYPLDVARGKAKIMGKCVFGDINLDVYNSIFFGQTLTTGEKILINNEAGATAIPTTPFQLTVAQAATFYMDVGVYFQTTGVRLVQVASGPVTGQYSVSAGGVYTFAAADTGKTVYFNYFYTGAATGKTLAINNLIMGVVPKFQVVLSEIRNGQTFTLLLYSCVCDKLSLPLKQDDFLYGETDFQALSNSAGQVGFMTMTGPSG